MTDETIDADTNLVFRLLLVHEEIKESDLFEKETKDIAYLLTVTHTIAETLKEFEKESEAWKPWSNLANAFLELSNGNQPEMFKIIKTKKPTLSPVWAGSMVLGAVTVSKAPRNEKTKVCRLAARKLGVSQKKLRNFRKNLMKDLGNPARYKITHIMYEHMMNSAPKGFGNSNPNKSNSPQTYEDCLKLLKPIKG
jgi:hypothetical protein